LPYLKCRTDHLEQQVKEEYVGIQPFSPLPPLRAWAWSRLQMEWPPIFKGPGRPPAITTVVPPPLFFFRCSKADKQRAAFFIWSCLRDRWLRSLEDTPYHSRDKFYLTHQQWRQILSGERFRKAAKKSSLQYDLRQFWKFDPSLLSTAEHELEDISPVLQDQTRLHPDDFLDSNEHAFDLKRLLCYDFAITHIKYQFERTDEELVRNKNLDPNVLEDRRRRRSVLFRDSRALLSAPPPWESPDLTVKAAWFEKLGTFLCDWPVDASRYGCLIGMQEPEFSRTVNGMLVDYYTWIIKTLNAIPTVMWTFPGTRGLDRFASI
jgi:hypothetical protein